MECNILQRTTAGKGSAFDGTAFFWEYNFFQRRTAAEKKASMPIGSSRIRQKKKQLISKSCTAPAAATPPSPTTFIQMKITAARE